MRDPTKTRQKLLETAIALVWQSNYCSVGVEEICKRAGVTKGAFYHHFESKADLFYEAAKYERETTQGDWDAIYASELTPLEKLEKLIDYIASGEIDARALATLGAPEQAFEVTGCPFFCAGGQVGIEEVKVRQAAMEMAEQGIQDATALVRSLKADGYLDGDANSEQVARMAFMFVQGLLIYARVYNSRTIVEADLRDGLYRVLDLKPEYRRAPERKGRAAMKSPATA